MIATYAITKNGVVAASVVLSDANDAIVSAHTIALRAGSVVQTPAIAAVPEVRDSAGNITQAAVVARPAVLRDPTALEALALRAGDFWQSMLNDVTDAMRQKAAEDAAAAIAPIVPQA